MPLRMSDECLGVVKGVPGGQGNVFWVLVGVLECPGVFFRCWRVYGELRRCLIVFFPLISFNFRKPHMRSLWFCSRPGAPKCLKYQNVQKLRSFWPIGKPRERFQSWVITVYFIPLLLDHTVQDSTTEVGYKSFHCINDCCQSLDNKEINMRGPGTSEEIQGSNNIKFLLRNSCRCHWGLVLIARKSTCGHMSPVLQKLEEGHIQLEKEWTQKRWK